MSLPPSPCIDIEMRPIAEIGGSTGGGSDCCVTWADVGTTVPGSAGGLQFDTWPQTGGWLYIETTGNPSFGGTPPNVGIYLKASSGTQIEGDFFCTKVGPDGVQIDSLDGGGILIRELGDGGIIINSDGGGITIRETTGGINIASDSDIDLTADGRVDIGSFGEMVIHAGSPGMDISALGAVQITGSSLQLFGVSGITMRSDAGDVVINAVSAGKTLALRSDAGPVRIQALNSATATVFGSSSGELGLSVQNSDSGSMDLHNWLATVAGAGGIKPGHNLALPWGSAFRLHDSTLEYLRVENVGGTVTYHIKSGAAWVADL